MDPYYVDFLGMLVRWLHIIAGIAWIGSSFYFIWLDNSIEPPPPGSEAAKKGVGGELWAVHGGGFYNPQKYTVAPPALPDKLHWFKWEAYTTWLSGTALLVLTYWIRAQADDGGPERREPDRLAGRRRRRRQHGGFLGRLRPAVPFAARAPQRPAPARWSSR